MRPSLFLCGAFLSGCFLSLLASPSAKAQCGVNSLGFEDVGIVTGNPFRADVIFTPERSPELHSALVQRPQSVARDSQGRVRIERVGGEFKRDNGPEAGSQVEEHTVVICDPVAETLTRINTVTATATIIHSRPSAPSSPRTPARTFCSSRLPSGHLAQRLQVEDLGTQVIEGVEAHGERITMPMLAAASGATPSEDSQTGAATSERWCSDSLSALVLTVNSNAKATVKSTIAMRNIDRSEPDPALFQIPPDYTVTESVAEPHERRTPNAAPSTQP